MTLGNISGPHANSKGAGMHCELVYDLTGQGGIIQGTQLIAQFESVELAKPMMDVLRSIWPSIPFRINEKINIQNYPRFVIVDGRDNPPRTIAQFEAEFGFLCEGYTLSLHQTFGPFYGFREVVIGAPNVKMMMPDFKHPGQFVQVGEQKPKVNLQ